jgi:hypothetical protein
VENLEISILMSYICSKQIGFPSLRTHKNTQDSSNCGKVVVNFGELWEKVENSVFI